MISKLKKLQKFSNKKVQFILTDKPRLLFVDPSKMTAKTSIIWSDKPSELNVQVANSSHFKICTVRFSVQHFWDTVRIYHCVPDSNLLLVSAEKSDFFRGFKRTGMAMEDSNRRASTSMNFLTVVNSLKHTAVLIVDWPRPWHSRGAPIQFCCRAHHCCSSKVLFPQQQQMKKHHYVSKFLYFKDQAELEIDTRLFRHDVD